MRRRDQSLVKDRPQWYAESKLINPSREANFWSLLATPLQATSSATQQLPA